VQCHNKAEKGGGRNSHAQWRDLPPLNMDNIWTNIYALIGVLGDYILWQKRH